MAQTGLRRWRSLGMTLVVVMAALLAAWYLWTHYFQEIWTRDARVRAVVISVAPQVSGQITEMAVQDNQYVHRGDRLLVIDQQHYQLALKSAKAQLEGNREQLDLQRSEAKRRRQLGNKISREAMEKAGSAADLAEAHVHAAKVAVASAQLDLKHTTVTAPVSGYVTHLVAHRGDYARTGTPVLTLVDSDSFWVEAYLKENQVHRIRVGDPVRVRLLGSDRDLPGRVQGIGRGIANSNAVSGSDHGLPTVTPTFEWVRLAQRIPVHVTLQEIPDDLLLAVGMTASVQVYPERRPPP